MMLVLMPKPNQMTNSGARATFGMVLMTIMYGRKNRLAGAQYTTSSPKAIEKSEPTVAAPMHAKSQSTLFPESVFVVAHALTLVSALLSFTSTY